MATDAERRKEFFWAASSGDLMLLKRLGKSLKHVQELENASGQTPLHLAAAGGHTEICDHLIKKFQLDVNARDENYDTPLNLAIMEDRTATAEFLIKKGANIMLSNDRAYTPLHYAAEQGNCKIVQLLISKGATVDINSESGTPLQCAAFHGKKETLKILLDNNADPNWVTKLYLTPLMLSIAADSLDCFKLLLKAGARPDLGSCGKTPLIVAACTGNTDMIKCLLQSRVNPDIPDFVCVTALEHAAMRGHVAALTILFPVTTRILSFPHWSVSGIMKHIFSRKANNERQRRRREIFQTAKSKGLDAFKKEDYQDAIYWYTEANLADPADASVLSNMSLCWARLNNGKNALSNAEDCVRLKPDWPKAHYREGAAWMLLQNYSMATEAFCQALKLDPDNQEIKKAHREAVEAEFGIPVSEHMRVIHVNM